MTVTVRSVEVCVVVASVVVVDAVIVVAGWVVLVYVVVVDVVDLASAAQYAFPLLLIHLSLQNRNPTL